MQLSGKTTEEKSSVSRTTALMDTKQPYKWRYFQFDIILLCIRDICVLDSISVINKLIYLNNSYDNKNH